MLNICLPQCDPLFQFCERGEGCYATATGFQCLPDLSAGSGALGEPCASASACDPGLACVSAESLPLCVGGDGCCTPLCAVGSPDDCEMLVPGTSCVSWFREIDEEPGCLDTTVGACVVAQ